MRKFADIQKNGLRAAAFLCVPAAAFALALALSMTAHAKPTPKSLTYLFGDSEYHVPNSLVKVMLSPENEEDELNYEAIESFVDKLKKRYDTAGCDRTFTTARGETVTIPAEVNIYGYIIDRDTEIRYLTKDLRSNVGSRAIRREPVYSQTGYSRYGADDLFDTYIEVDLTAQHLWYFYDRCENLVESDVVTGCYNKGTVTPTGAYQILYKQTPARLRGSNSAGSWDVEVSYWMQFYKGFGLHDAAWRSEFGGDIYMDGGSHGCVNLPWDTADVLYYSAAKGTPVIVHE